MFGCGLGRRFGSSGFIGYGPGFCADRFWWSFGWRSNRRSNLGQKCVEVDFVLAAPVDAVEGGENLPGEANTLGAPLREEQENGGGSVVRVDAWGFIGCKQGDGQRDAGEIGAEKGVLVAGFSDGYGFVGRESGGQCCIEFGDRFCSGGRVSGELLERSVGECVGDVAHPAHDVSGGERAMIAGEVAHDPVGFVG